MSSAIKLAGQIVENKDEKCWSVKSSLRLYANTTTTSRTAKRSSVSVIASDDHDGRLEQATS